MIERRFFIDGKVCGKGRPRMTKKGWVYTPKKTRQYEKKILEEYQKKYQSALPFTGPVMIFITALFEKAKRGKTAYPARPDLDNIIKIICDALNGVAWNDDKQITTIVAEKKFSSVAGVYVIIKTEA